MRETVAASADRMCWDARGLQVDFLRPTPMGPPLEVRGRIEEVKGRKVVVSATVSAGGEVCAKGKVVAVQMPEHLRPKG